MKFNSSLKCIVSLSFLFASTSLAAQTDNRFWFTIPDLADMGSNSSIQLNIATIHPTELTLSRPADSTFIPIIFSLKSWENTEIRLDSLLPIHELEVFTRDLLQPNLIQNKGFLLEAVGGSVSAFCEFTHYFRDDVLPLKGCSALGTQFTVSTQSLFNNSSSHFAYNGFTVLATDDATTVHIEPKGNELYPGGSSPFDIVLNKGETFAIRSTSQTSIGHINGVKVTSDKDISVAVYDDLIGTGRGGDARNLFTDQLVPDELAGTEFLILKGDILNDPEDSLYGESIFITAIENTTTIYSDTVLLAYLDAGETLHQHLTKDPLYIRSTKPITINHITSYYQTMRAGVQLPAMNSCNGSYRALTIKYPHLLHPVFHNLVVRNDTVSTSSNKNQAVKHFTYSIGGEPAQAIPPEHFSYSKDSLFAYFDREKAGGDAYYLQENHNRILVVQNSLSPFHLGVMQPYNATCSYGYATNYGYSKPTAGIEGMKDATQKVICGVDSVLLVAGNGLQYQWNCINSICNNSNLGTPENESTYFYPDTSGDYMYSVTINGSCISSDTVIYLRTVVRESTEAGFDISADHGCSPLTVEYTNTSTPDGGKAVWFFNHPNNSYIDTLPNTFTKTYLNSSDTIQKHIVRLLYMQSFNSCPDEKIDTLIIHPFSDQIANFFIADTLANCESKVLQITDLSSGSAIDSVHWDFGDGISSNTKGNQEHSYTRLADRDTVYYVRLELIDSSGCTASMEESITLRQPVNARFNFSDTAGCSPLSIQIENLSEGLTDSCITDWFINDLYVDTQQEFDTLFGYSIPNDITKHIAMLVSNQDGCSDTLTQQVYIHPQPSGYFDRAWTTPCSPVYARYSPNVEHTDSIRWIITGPEFMNRIDTLPGFMDLTFFDTSYPGADTFSVSILLKNMYGCTNTLVDSHIIVHPQAEAAFSMDTSAGYSPLPVQFTNLSAQADTFLWIFPGSLQSELADPEFTFTSEEADTIDVMLIARNTLCPDTAIQSVVILTPSALEQLEDSQLFQYYYSKESDELFLNLNATEAITLSARVYSMKGQLVSALPTEALSVGNNQRIIPMQQQQDGVYVLQVILGSETYLGKFIKH